MPTLSAAPVDQAPMRCIVSAAAPTQWQRAVDELTHVASHCDAPRVQCCTSIGGTRDPRRTA